MNAAKHVIDYDEAHLRIDLRQIPAHALTLLLALWWGTHDYSSVGALITRVVIAAIFLTITRWTACRLGASRLSSVLAALLVIVFFWQTGSESLGELTLFMAAVLASVEYFKTRNKVLAVGYGLVLGMLAAVLPDKKGLLLLTLFLGAVLVRTLWHALIERLSKLQLLLFAAKAVVIAILAIGIHVVIGPHVPSGWVLQSYVALPQLSPSFLGLIIVLALWGLWSTMLLATRRSPKHRGMRLFFTVFAALVIMLVALIRSYGPDVLRPQVMQVLAQTGLTTYNAETMIFAVFTIVLLITAGIDRTLYKDVAWVRTVRAKLDI